MDTPAYRPLIPHYYVCPFTALAEFAASVLNLLSVPPRDSEHLWDFKGSATHGVASKKIDALRKDFQVRGVPVSD